MLMMGPRPAPGFEGDLPLEAEKGLEHPRIKALDAVSVEGHGSMSAFEVKVFLRPCGFEMFWEHVFHVFQMFKLSNMAKP